jgi:hypothetical protein
VKGRANLLLIYFRGAYRYIPVTVAP